MPKEDLIKYIEEAKSRGLGDDAIRTTLLYAHWTKEEIAEAFKGYDDSRTRFDPATLSRGMKIKSIDFNSRGKPVAGTIEKRSHGLLVIFLILVFIGAAIAFWYIGSINGSFIRIDALPPPK